MVLLVGGVCVCSCDSYWVLKLHQPCWRFWCQDCIWRNHSDYVPLTEFNNLIYFNSHMEQYQQNFIWSYQSLNRVYKTCPISVFITVSTDGLASGGQNFLRHSDNHFFVLYILGLTLKRLNKWSWSDYECTSEFSTRFSWYHILKIFIFNPLDMEHKYLYRLWLPLRCDPSSLPMLCVNFILTDNLISQQTDKWKVVPSFRATVRRIALVVWQLLSDQSTSTLLAFCGD